MTKEENTKYISKFLPQKDNLNYNIKVLCATRDVRNTGIDYPNFRVVYHIDIASSVLDTTQEMGCTYRRYEASKKGYKYTM